MRIYLLHLCEKDKKKWRCGTMPRFGPRLRVRNRVCGDIMIRGKGNRSVVEMLLKTKFVDLQYKTSLKMRTHAKILS